MGLFDNLTYAFNAKDPTSPEGLRLRQDITRQLIANSKKGYPKNVGEGLTAIGDAFGDVGMANRLYAAQTALEESGAKRGEEAATLPGQEPVVPQTNDPSRPEITVDPAGKTMVPVPTPRPPEAPFIAPRPGNPSTGSRSEITPPVQTADASYFPDPATAQPSIPSSMVPQLGQPSPGPINPAQGSQFSLLLGGPAPTASPYAPTASLDQPPILANDAIRNAVVAPPGGPPQNPMLAGSVPQSLGASPALRLGSEPDSVPPTAMPGVRLAQASPDGSALNPRVRPDVSRPEVIIGPAGKTMAPVPPTPTEPRPAEAPYKTPQPGNPPRLADPSPQEAQLDKLSRDYRILQSQREGFAGQAAAMAAKRKADYDQASTAFKTRDDLFRAAQERAAKAPETELARQKAEQERQASDYKEQITRFLGGRDPAVIEEGLAKSKASIANIPAVMDSIQRVRNVADKMYTGPFADAEAFLSQVMPFGMDKSRGTATQQFRTAMTDIMAAHRAAVVGPGSQSGPELALLQKATAADTKLTKDTIKEAIDAGERLMVKTAIAHQQQVRDYAGDFDPNRIRSVYNSFGVPGGMANIVPQTAVNNLFTYRDNAQAIKDFNEKYHTPGLAQEVLRLRRPQ